MTWTTIKHDGFARESLVRHSVVQLGYPGAPKMTCDSCGGTRKNGRLWEYATVKDDSLSGRVNEINGKFCCVSCLRSYIGD